MADIDWPAFSEVLRGRLRADGRTFAQIAADEPSLNKAVLSRATHGQMVGAGNYIALCSIFNLSARAFLTDGPANHSGYGRSGNAVENQRVSPRDTREAERGA